MKKTIPTGPAKVAFSALTTLTLCLFFGASVVQPVFAATDYWLGGVSSGNWSSGANWLSGSAPAPLDSLVFTNQSGANDTAANDFAAGTPFDGITFSTASAGSTFSLTGNSILLSGATNGITLGITNATALAETVNNNLTLNWGCHTFNNGGGGSLALNGNMTPNTGALAYFPGSGVSSSSFTTDGNGLISGLDGLGLIGTNTLALLPLATVSGGSVVPLPIGSYTSVASGAISSSATANVELSATTTAAYTDNSISVNTITSDKNTGNTGGTQTITVTTTGTLTLGSQGGIYVTDAGTVGGKQLLNLTGGNLTSGTTSAGGTIVFGVNGTTSANQMEMNSVIQNNSASGPVTVVKAGPGSMYFNTANTYSGGTYVDQGYLQANNLSSFGSGPVYVASGATVYPSVSGTYANALYLSPGLGANALQANVGAVKVSAAGAVTFSGNLTLLGAPTASAPGDRFSAGESGAFNVNLTGQITGPGTLDLCANGQYATYYLDNTSVNANNWTGGLLVNASFASADSEFDKDSASNQFNGNNLTLLQTGSATARFDFNGFNDTIGGLSSSGTSADLQVDNFGGTPSVLTLGTNNTTATFGGVISDNGNANNLSIVKIGSGTQTLSAPETYVGSTTVNAGTLALAGGNVSSSGLYKSSSLIINNGGTVQVNVDNSLAGFGSPLGSLPVAINAGGTLTGLGTADGGAGTSSHIRGLLTLNGGTLAMGGTENQPANGTWSLDDGVATAGGNTMSTISALNVVPDEIGGTIFNIPAGATSSGIDLDVTGTLIDGASASDTGIIKNGSGILVLGGANTYAGNTTINGGTLLVNGSIGSLTVSIGNGALGGIGMINSTVTTTSANAQINQETNFLVTSTVGTLALGSSLNMSSGGTCYLDAGTTYSSGDDMITVAGALTLNNNTFHIHALSGSANLDTTGDYVLIQGSSPVSGSVNLTPIWDGMMPANGASFTVVISGNNVVLHYTTSGTLSIVSATATPFIASRYQNPVLSVTVTNGTAPYAVTVDASSVGGSSTLALVRNASQPAGVYIYTNKVALTGVANGNYTLPISVIDNVSGMASGTIALTVIGAPLTWNGDASGNSYWDTGGEFEWQGIEAYQDGDFARFDDTAAANPNVTNVDLLANLNPGSITVSNTTTLPTGSYTLSGFGDISGATSLFKQGSGTLTMTESGGDSFSGGILVGGGSLILSNTSVNITGGITVTNGTATVAYSGTVSGGLTVSGGSATLLENGGTTLNGGVTVSNGLVLLDQTTTPAGSTSIGGGGTLQVGSNDANGVLPSGTITDNGALVFNRSDTALTLSTIISGAGAVTNNGSGTVTLNGVESYNGLTTVNAGTLAITAPNQGVSGIAHSSGLIINNGGTFQVNGNNALAGSSGGPLPVTINAGGTLTGLGTANAGAGTSSHIRGLLTLNGGTLTMGGSQNQPAFGTWALDFGVAVNGGTNTSTINCNNVLPDQSGVTIFTVAAGGTPSGIDLNVTGTLISGTSFDMGISKLGAGTMALDANNTYAKGTTINAGTMQLGETGDASALTSPLGTGTVTNNAALNFASSQSVTVGNVISGTGTLMVSSGTGILTAADTYTGNTTIGAGTLALSGSGSIANSGNVIIAGGATFDVSGLSSAFTLGSSQTLSNSTSTAVINGNAGTGSGTLSLTYSSGTPSLMTTNGALTLASTTVVKINNTGAALTGGVYTIITNDPATGSVSGTPPSSINVTGGGIAAGLMASLQISGNELNLVVGSASPPVITGISVSGITLTLTATNGAAGGQYVLLESTNVARPLNQWTPVLTNNFNGGGDLNLSTNIVNPNNAQEFYILSQ